MNYVRRIISSMWLSFVLNLPLEFSRLRVNQYIRQGCKISKRCNISPNVRISGKFEMGSGSSIAYNCVLSGFHAGIFIGQNVMIAPNVVIVAFNHISTDITKPMSKQGLSEDKVIIEDDVWIGANCTIGKGVRIGTGSIVAANSFVNKSILPYSIVGGVPAKLIRQRS